MEKIKKLLRKNNKPYRDLPVRVIISLLAAHFILSHTTKYGFFEVILVNGYFFSLIPSFLIALTIFYAVYKTTLILDRRFPYVDNWKKRAIYQIIFGGIAVALLAIALAFILFCIIKEPERIWRYFNQDFTMVLAYIMGINAYYLIVYMFSLIRKLIVNMFRLLKLMRREVFKNHILEEITPPQQKSIAAIYISSHRHYQVLYMDGTSAQWLATLEKTISQLSEKEYLLINRQCIIGIEAIRCIEITRDKHFLITLKGTLQHSLPKGILKVSRPVKAKFTKWIGDKNLWI